MELTSRAVRCCSFLVLSLLLVTPLAAQFTGTWSGTYQDQWNCGGTACGCNFISTGPVLLVLTQSGNQVTGTATFEFSADACQVLPSPQTLTGPVEGTVSGKTFNGTMLGHGPERAAILTLSDDDATLAVQFKISQSDPPEYFLSANLIRGPLTTPAVTGSWSGIANSTTRCANGVIRSGSAPFALALTEQNGGVTGVATIEVEYLDAGCLLKSRETVRLPLTGTVSGDTLTATVLTPFEVDSKMAISATVSGPAMSLAFIADETTGSVALTRTSTTTPDSRFAGAWNGNYVINQGPEQGCPGLPTFSGPASATFFHAGSEISGLMTLFDTKHYDQDGVLHDCRLHEHYDYTVFLSGSVSGNIANGPGVVVWANEGAGEDSHPIPLTLTLNGNTLTASVGEGFATFSFVRNSTALPPIIMRFEAPVPSITRGQSSTLRWNTFNATSVTIDNGVGPQATSGSVAITPMVTTTYTLTATVSGGTVTAETTVTVRGDSRRRAVRH